MSDYVELSNLTKITRRPNGPAVIVKDFNLRIKKGEFVTLIGHSGCGKSTVLSMLAGLNDISGGGIILAGKELAGPGPDRGVVFQSPCLLPWMTAFENVMLGVDQVFSRRQQNGAATSCGILSRRRRPRGFDAQASARAFAGHAAARRDRARVRVEAQDAAARRAVRHVGFAHPNRACNRCCSNSGAGLNSRR